MLQRQPLLNFINQLNKLEQLDLYTNWQKQKMDPMPKCLLTQPINMPSPLWSNSYLTAIMLVTSRVLLRKFGNIVEEFYTKENIFPLALNKKRTLMMLT